LYALNPLDRYLSGRVNLEPDQTIEILMTELDPKIMEIFTKAQSSTGREATEVFVVSLNEQYFVDHVVQK
jgi:S-adenosylmethionine decarboxylase